MRVTKGQLRRIIREMRDELHPKAKTWRDMPYDEDAWDEDVNPYGVVYGGGAYDDEYYREEDFYDMDSPEELRQSADWAELEAGELEDEYGYHVEDDPEALGMTEASRRRLRRGVRRALRESLANGGGAFPGLGFGAVHSNPTVGFRGHVAGAHVNEDHVTPDPEQFGNYQGRLAELLLAVGEAMNAVPRDLQHQKAALSRIYDEVGSLMGYR